MSSQPHEGSERGRTADGSGDEPQTVVGAPRSLDDALAQPTEPGASVGRYVVLEEVGSGGMGRVLRAYDPKLQREVALKQVQADMLGVAGARRLVAEARAMAKLSHPNVVAVYDVEELEGVRVVVVMEYVAGATLRQWMEQASRSWREVVRAFMAAGRGLRAAHEVGLLHRDFKPSNVLVATSGAVKVTDFGLAKVKSVPTTDEDGVQPDDRGRVDLTRTGAVHGTPRYMAPEQHRGRQLTVAADQYSFCVALWEGLCGEPPFPGETFEELMRLKKRGPPAWPVADVPRPIADAIRRGLDCEPQKRWPSMQALLDALAYDPAKRRGRWLLAGVGVGVVGLVGTAYASWVTARSEQCTGAAQHLAGVWDDARREQVRKAIAKVEASFAKGVWERTSAQLDRYADAWAAMHTDTCEATTLRGEQSTRVMDLRMACLQRAKLELVAVAQVLAEADVDVVQNADDLVGSLADLSRCADVEALSAEVEPPSTKDAEAVEEIRGSLAVAKAEREAGRYTAAAGPTQQAEQRLADVDYGPVRTEVLLARGLLDDGVGRYDEAESALREALELGAQFRQSEAMRDAATMLVFIVGVRLNRMQEGLHFGDVARGLAAGEPQYEADVLTHIALVHKEAGAYDDAEAMHEQALELRKDALGPMHPDVAASLDNLAMVFEARDEHEKAKELLEQAVAIRESALGPEHPHVTASLNNLAVVHEAMGEYEEARALYERVLAVAEEGLGAEHPTVALALNNLANVHYGLDEYEQAMPLYERAHSIFVKALGAEHPTVATSLNNIANLHEAMGDYDEAKAGFRRAVAMFEKTLGPEHPSLAHALIGLANAHHQTGAYAAAMAAGERALAIRETALGPEHPDVATTLGGLAQTHEAMGEHHEARARYERALTIFEKAAGRDHPSVVAPLVGLARVSMVQDRAADAVAFAQRAVEVGERGDAPAGELDDARSILARHGNAR